MQQTKLFASLALQPACNSVMATIRAVFVQVARHTALEIEARYGGVGVLDSETVLAGRVTSRPMELLAAGQPLRVVTLGGSAATGSDAGGAEGAFPAVLVRRLNAMAQSAEAKYYVAASSSSPQLLGRADDVNMAIGDTNSLFAGLHVRSLVPRPASPQQDDRLLLWDYTINDGRSGTKVFTPEARRFLLSVLLRQLQTLHPAPPLLMAFGYSYEGSRLLDSLKAGGCRLHNETFVSDLPVLLSSAWPVGAVHLAGLACALEHHRPPVENPSDPVGHVSLEGWVSLNRTGHAHPSRHGHEVTAELLLRALIRAWLPGNSQSTQPSQSSGRNSAAADQRALLVEEQANITRSCTPPRLPQTNGSNGSIASSSALLAHALMHGRADSYLAWQPSLASPMSGARAGNGSCGSSRLRVVTEPLQLRIFMPPSNGRRDAKSGAMIPSCDHGRMQFELMLAKTHRLSTLVWYASFGSGQAPINHGFDALEITVNNRVLHQDRASEWTAVKTYSRQMCGWASSVPMFRWAHVPEEARKCNDGLCAISFCVPKKGRGSTRINHSLLAQEDTDGYISWLAAVSLGSGDGGGARESEAGAFSRRAGW